MCLVVDANCCHQIVNGFDSAAPIFDWLRRNGHIATGGKNLTELLRAGLGEFFANCDRKGRLHKFSAERIDEQCAYIDEDILCSNDIHVLALVRVSGARLVFTMDKKLIDDLKNLAVIPRRHGKKVEIYRSERDRRKLFGAPPCHSP